eukprot:CAMPEP_0194489914 /NCGR_PEP_ID=MMETSP0253-20130528/9298_1 /TAXON_ID=2966 /ORGANISM="Noctiluca scintillans" /LENGTH=107 /DNA_ID=CAMNT_0039330465 /DNA_START=319 /DNA_END=639 /DNA_ORIENTATION=+
MSRHRSQRTEDCGGEDAVKGYALQGVHAILQTTAGQLEIQKQMGCLGPLGLHKTCSNFDRSLARFKRRFGAEKVMRKIPCPPVGELETVSRWRAPHCTLERADLIIT